LLSIHLIPYSYGVEVFHFSLDLYTIGRTRWMNDRPVARSVPKCRTAQTQKNAHTHQTSMPELGFEPTITGSERAKTVHAVHALDCSATVIGHHSINK
jgi:hypothetical protein